MLDGFIHWLEATPASDLIQKIFWIIPTVQTVHILAISAVFASMSMLDLRLLGFAGTRQSVASTARRFLPWMWWSLIILATTGSILIVGEPHRALGNVSFTLKMCMLAAAIGLTLTFQAILRGDLAAGHEDLAPRHVLFGRAVGFASLVLWMGIVIAGRLIAYTS